jgi:hypothetical protein
MHVASFTPLDRATTTSRKHGSHGLRALIARWTWRIVRSVPLFLGATLACAPRAIPPEKIQIAAAVVEEPSIVWWTVGESYESAWIEPAASGHVVIARRAEAVLASNKTLWAFRKRRLGEIKLCASCACLLEEPQPPGTDCTPKSTGIWMYAFVRLTDGKLLVDKRLETDGDSTQCSMVEFEPTARLEASVGAEAVVGRDTYVYGCGAHGFYSNELGWLDLDREGPGREPKPPSVRAEALVVEAKKLLEEAGEGCFEDKTNVTHFATHVRYSERGVPTLAYEYTSPTSYVCGTGPGHYSISAVVETRDLPERLVKYATVPSYLQSFLKALPAAAKLGGISHPKASMRTLYQDLNAGVVAIPGPSEP